MWRMLKVGMEIRFIYDQWSDKGAECPATGFVTPFAQSNVT